MLEEFRTRVKTSALFKKKKNLLKLCLTRAPSSGPQEKYHLVGNHYSGYTEWTLQAGSLADQVRRAHSTNPLIALIKTNPNQACRLPSFPIPFPSGTYNLEHDLKNREQTYICNIAWATLSWLQTPQNRRQTEYYKDVQFNKKELSYVSKLSYAPNHYWNCPRVKLY